VFFAFADRSHPSFALSRPRSQPLRRWRHSNARDDQESCPANVARSATGPPSPRSPVPIFSGICTFVALDVVTDYTVPEPAWRPDHKLIQNWSQISVVNVIASHPSACDPDIFDTFFICT